MRVSLSLHRDHSGPNVWPGGRRICLFAVAQIVNSGETGRAAFPALTRRSRHRRGNRQRLLQSSLLFFPWYLWHSCSWRIQTEPPPSIPVPSHRPQKQAFLIPEDFSQPCLGPAFWNSTAAVCAIRGRVWQENGRQQDFGVMGTRLFRI